ncbi:DNA-directed polymerase-like protein kappa [Phyllosticta citriasiana]|uniref:DNA-directed polymerase-like protein kappa n=1 Tax=Phyllosticta citriasiana TaxID=595635 RepID=UPI0030FD6016
MSHEPHADPDPAQLSPSDPPQPAAEPAPSADDLRDVHYSLKHHLLGPSLQKSGQDGVDQKKVADVIYNASKGSKYFNNEESKDKVLTEKISRILERKRQLERLDLSHDRRRADDFIAELELSRDLSQTIVHIDCDAFYAAVEELERPELKHVPFAVGKGVLTTCNYHARKFGCRSGMAGFIAMKLCPQLICLPMNFDKYGAKANEVREVLAVYDPRFESASIDEAYLNITKYCEEHGMTPENAVEQLRREVHEKTKITVSAGIAANAKLAKIASNKNKPNGQFRIPSDRASIMEFMRDMPTRKVNGVGRVLERELQAIGVQTCGDIYEHRAILPKLFGEKASKFLIGCFLGIGRTKVAPAEESERKSVGTESTFKDMTSKDELRAKLRRTADELQGDLERTQFKGRTLVLKVKLHTYEVLTRQTNPPFAVWKADDLYKYSLPMFVKLEKEIPNMTLRLMGLRVTHLVSMKKPGIDEFFGLSKRNTTPDATTSAGPRSNPRPATTADDEGEWEVWPEAEFEEAARQEREDEFAETLRLSQQQEHGEGGQDQTPQTSPGIKHGRQFNAAAKEEQQQEQLWDCPICMRPQPAKDRALNEHIDFCLSRDAIRETVREANAEGTPQPQEASASPQPGTATTTAESKNVFGFMGTGAGSGGVALSANSNGKRKRGRPRADGLGQGQSGNKKLFFG